MDLNADVPRAGASPSTGSGHESREGARRSCAATLLAVMLAGAFAAGALVAWLVTR